MMSLDGLGWGGLGEMRMDGDGDGMKRISEFEADQLASF